MQEPIILAYIHGAEIARHCHIPTQYKDWVWSVCTRYSWARHMVISNLCKMGTGNIPRGSMCRYRHHTAEWLENPEIPESGEGSS